MSLPDAGFQLAYAVLDHLPANAWCLRFYGVHLLLTADDQPASHADVAALGEPEVRLLIGELGGGLGGAVDGGANGGADPRPCVIELWPLARGGMAGQSEWPGALAGLN